MVAIERWPTPSGITQSIRDGTTQSVNDFQYIVVVVICWEENISPIKNQAHVAVTRTLAAVIPR